MALHRAALHRHRCGCLAGHRQAALQQVAAMAGDQVEGPDAGSNEQQGDEHLEPAAAQQGLHPAGAEAGRQHCRQRAGAEGEHQAARAPGALRGSRPGEAAVDQAAGHEAPAEAEGETLPRAGDRQEARRETLHRAPEDRPGAFHEREAAPPVGDVQAHEDEQHAREVAQAEEAPQPLGDVKEGLKGAVHDRVPPVVPLEVPEEEPVQARHQEALVVLQKPGG